MSNTDRTGRVMYGAVFVVLLLLVALASYTPAAILQAIIPASVPAANKQGSTGTKFLIANGAYTNGHLVSVDASGNAVDFGTATSLGSINGQALNFNGSINLPAGAQTAGGLFFSQNQTTSVNTAGFSSIIGTGGGSTTIAAGALNSNGAVLAVRASGMMNPNVSGTVINMHLSIGGTTCGTGAFTLPLSSASMVWNLNLYSSTYTTGATGSLYCSGQIVFATQGSSSGTPIAILPLDSGGTVPNINLTGTLAIDFLVAQTSNAGSFATHNLTLSPF